MVQIDYGKNKKQIEINNVFVPFQLTNEPIGYSIH